jgi:hypothetical protein
MRELAGTSSLVKERRTYTAESSWHSAFPWDEGNTLPWLAKDEEG